MVRYTLYTVMHTLNVYSLPTDDWSNAPDPRRERVSAGTFSFPALYLNSKLNSAKARLQRINLLDLGADSVR